MGFRFDADSQTKQVAPAKERLLKTAELAAFYGYQPSTIREMCRDGRLPAFKVGPEFRIKESDLDRIIDRQRPQPSANVPDMFLDLDDSIGCDHVHGFAVRPVPWDSDSVQLVTGTGGPNGCYVWLDPEAADELIAALQEARKGRASSAPKWTGKAPTHEELEAAKVHAREVAKPYAPKPRDLEAMSQDDLVREIQKHGFGDLGFAWLRNVVEAGGGSFDKLKADHMINALRNPDQFR